MAEFRLFRAYDGRTLAINLDHIHHVVAIADDSRDIVELHGDQGVYRVVGTVESVAS